MKYIVWRVTAQIMFQGEIQTLTGTNLPRPTLTGGYFQHRYPARTASFVNEAADVATAAAANTVVVVIAESEASTA